MRDFIKPIILVVYARNEIEEFKQWFNVQLGISDVTSVEKVVFVIC